MSPAEQCFHRAQLRTQPGERLNTPCRHLPVLMVYWKTFTFPKQCREIIYTVQNTVFPILFQYAGTKKDCISISGHAHCHMFAVLAVAKAAPLDPTKVFWATSHIIIPGTGTEPQLAAAPKGKHAAKKAPAHGFVKTHHFVQIDPDNVSRSRHGRVHHRLPTASQVCV